MELLPVSAFGSSLCPSAIGPGAMAGEVAGMGRSLRVGRSDGGASLGVVVLEADSSAIAEVMLKADAVTLNG